MFSSETPISASDFLILVLISSLVNLPVPPSLATVFPSISVVAGFPWASTIPVICFLIRACDSDNFDLMLLRTSMSCCVNICLSARALASFRKDFSSFVNWLSFNVSIDTAYFAIKLLIDVIKAPKLFLQTNHSLIFHFYTFGLIP